MPVRCSERSPSHECAELGEGVTPWSNWSRSAISPERSRHFESECGHWQSRQTSDSSHHTKARFSFFTPHLAVRQQVLTLPGLISSLSEIHCFVNRSFEDLGPP